MSPTKPQERYALTSRLCVLAILSFGLAGCGEAGPAKVDARGKVTLDGTPLPKGSIVLDPADGKGGAYAGSIENGDFFVRTEPGPKIVRIAATKETGEKDQYGSPVSVSLIPDRYNGKSTLKADVAAKGTADLKYELSSAKK